MKYQIEVSELTKRRNKINPVTLRPKLNIKDAAYWQKRAAALLLMNHVSVVVAK